ncbi:MAG: sigma-70 family RNA polymerase sigma factor [Bacteroidia bacterium]
MKRKITYQGEKTDIDQLATRLAAGDPEAIELIYRNYFHRLLYYGIQVAGSQYQHETEDVIQEFFIWLAQNHNKAGKIQNLESYMFQSIRRNIQARLSADKNAQASFERYNNLTTPLRENVGHSPEQDLIQKEEVASRSDLIRQELEKLPPYQREVLYLRYFEDKSYQEIADILSVSDQVVYNYVSRAMKNLKKHLANLSILLLFPFGFFRPFP